jgi:hypothetical protein
MTFGYLSSFLVMTLLVVGVAMPTPGQVGGFHEMYKLAVMLFLGVPKDTAVAAGIVLHAVSFVPVTLLGVTFMAREGLTFGRVREMAARDTGGAAMELHGAEPAASEGRTEPPRSGSPSAQRGGAVAGPRRAE